MGDMRIGKIAEEIQTEVKDDKSPGHCYGFANAEQIICFTHLLDIVIGMISGDRLSEVILGVIVETRGKGIENVECYLQCFAIV